MAKYDLNHSKMKKLQDKTSVLLGIKPIIIPKDKLEIAHLTVKKYKKRVVYLVLLAIIELAMITYLIVK